MLLNGKPLKYPKTQVMERLVANRSKHIADFDEALAGYEKQRLERLNELVACAKTLGLSVPAPAEDVTSATKQIERRLLAVTGLSKPVSYIDSYDRVIDQLGMTSDDQVDMDDQTFDSYMRDEWAWKKQFTASTSTYKGG
jgi:hypothetical protein